MDEFELRYEIADDDVERVLAAVSWSPPQRVCDLTFGPTGATSMQTHGWVVRLRSVDDRVSLEYKAPLNDEWSAWSEVSVQVDSFAAAARILQLIGLQPGLLVDRTRRKGRHDAVELSLDDLVGVGTLIEFEVNGASPESEVDGASSESEARRVIADAAAALGVDLSSGPVRPYGELLLALINQDPQIRDEHDRRVSAMSDGGGDEEAT